MSNTDSADINEIQLGAFLSNNWKNFVDSSQAKTQLELKRKKVGELEFATQTQKAEAMAKEVMSWAKSNGFSGKISGVWWTARPGVLSKAVGQDVDSRKNPTDILIKFDTGKFLGISAKSTKTQGDIGFKNPGYGTIEKSLGKFKEEYPQKAIDELLLIHSNLSRSAPQRKSQVRSNPPAKEKAEELGSRVLNQIRDDLYSKLKLMNEKDLAQYILDDWMDAKEVYPRYIKVTGMKTGATVEDPLANSKIDALVRGKIKLEKIGNDSVGVTASGKRIMKMRAKYESQKLASSVKFSGDPWK